MEENQPILIERVYNAPVDKTWEALTDPSKMKEWYFNVPEFKPEEGSSFSFSAGPPGKEYKHLCKITEVEPQEKLSYTWEYPGYEGSSEVCFELSEAGNQTALRLTHKGLESFPSSEPDFAKENFIKGWEEILGSSLKNFLEKKM